MNFKCLSKKSPNISSMKFSAAYGISTSFEASKIARETSFELGDIRLSTLFYDFLRMLPGNIYCKNKSSRYFLVSDYLLFSSGFSKPTDVIGKTDFDLFPKDEAEQLKSNDISVMKNETTMVFSEKISFENGEKRYYEVIKSPLKDISGNLIGIIGNSIEVTKRHQVKTEHQ